MPLVLLDPLFLGVTSSGARKTLQPLIEANPHLTRFLIPCAGQFTVAEALRNAGVPASFFYCSDISLFSSVLGYIADKDKNVADLGFEATGSDLQRVLHGLPSGTDVQLAAKIFMSIKWTQIQGDKDFFFWQRVEFEAQSQTIFQKYADSIQAFRDKMGGMHYEMMDAEEHIRQFMGDPNTMVWHSPPWYSGGYEKMFDPKGHYTWKAPVVPALEPIAAEAFLEVLRAAPAHVLMDMVENHPTAQDGSGWYKHHVAYNEKTNKRAFILSNKEVSGVLQRKKVKPLPKGKKVLPIYADQDITAESRIEIRPCEYETAIYYYDLFVHELGMANAETFYLFLIDGRVAGVCGYFMEAWRMQRKPVAFENFGISVLSKKYKRLDKLRIMATSCQEFINMVERSVSASLLPTKITHRRTACLSKYPEITKNRGVMKLTDRKKLPNGRYHLMYETPIWQRSIADCLAIWLKTNPAATAAESPQEQEA